MLCPLHRDTPTSHFSQRSSASTWSSRREETKPKSQVEQFFAGYGLPGCPAGLPKALGFEASSRRSGATLFHGSPRPPAPPPSRKKKEKGTEHTNRAYSTTAGSFIWAHRPHSFQLLRKKAWKLCPMFFCDLSFLKVPFLARRRGWDLDPPKWCLKKDTPSHSCLGQCKEFSWGTCRKHRKRQRAGPSKRHDPSRLCIESGQGPFRGPFRHVMFVSSCWPPLVSSCRCFPAFHLSILVSSKHFAGFPLGLAHCSLEAP